MKRIYISGKITGDPNYREKFKKEEDRLYDLGYDPVNPAALVSANTEWTDAVRIALRAMLLCDGVSLLPDWRKSKGAKIEARLARKLGMDVRESRKWDEWDKTNPDSPMGTPWPHDNIMLG